MDITISNVVSHFSVRCHLNLRTIATNGSNVVYQREQSVSAVCVTMLGVLFYFCLLFHSLEYSDMMRMLGVVPCPGS